MIKFYSYGVPGFFSEGDFVFYESAFVMLPQKARIVEVGSFKGRSSSFMATLIANSNREVNFYCVDTWQGSEEHQKGASAEDADVVKGSLFDVFTKNMEPVLGYYTPVQLDSVAAALTFEDKSLDMVFIDASHDYENVIADINAWLPKVKTGGIISGHDSFYPPIKKAVLETVGQTKIIGACWYKVI